MPLRLLTLRCLSLYSFSMPLFLCLFPYHDSCSFISFQLFIGSGAFVEVEAHILLGMIVLVKVRVCIHSHAKWDAQGGGRKTDGVLESWIQDIQVPICELYRSLENLIVGGGSSFEGAL